MCAISPRKLKDAINRAFGLKSPREEEYATAEEVKEVIAACPDIISAQNIKAGVLTPDENAVQENGTDAEEEWVWVTGYKGMNKDMQCRNNFQYELGNRYDMPEDEKVEVCERGFHLCLKLEDVFKYVDICDGNRFFEVRALVRKKDKDAYGTEISGSYWRVPGYDYTVNKLAAKSIEIVRELTTDEILESTVARNWESKYKMIYLARGYKSANKAMWTDELVNECGYSFPFAQWLVVNKKYNIAKAMASVEGLSMDMRVYCIMK